MDTTTPERLPLCALHDPTWRLYNSHAFIPLIGLPELHILSTNGVLIYGFTGDGVYMLAHFNNIAKPPDELKAVKVSIEKEVAVRPTARQRAICNDL